MSFGEAIRTCLRKFATFSGRAGRAEYWWFYLFTVIVSLPANLIDIPGLEANLAVLAISLLSGLASLALLIPTLAATWRRLHDSDKSGFWGLLPVLGMVPFLILPFVEGMAVLFVSLALFFLLSLYVLYLLIRAGTEGPNRFGPDPRAPEGEELAGVFT